MIAARTAIEDGIVDRLRSLESAGRLRMLAPYNGELDGGVDEIESTKVKIAGRYPGLLVSTAQGNFREVSIKRRRVHQDVRVDVFIVNNQASGRESRNREDRTGSYSILQDAMALLIGHKLEDTDGYSFGVLVPVDEAKLHHAPDIQIWRQTYTIAVQIDAVEPVAGPIAFVDSSINAQDGEDDAGNPLVAVENEVA